MLASAGGNDVATIAKLVQTSPDRVREMIHRFNEKGLSALDPMWAGGRPRRITTIERAIIVSSAAARPTTLDQPFTRWSIRKLERYLATKERLVVSRERLRQILAEEQITFQATKTWKESPDPLREEKLARIEHILEHERERTFSFDEFGPLAIKPEGGQAWATRKKPVRLRANYHKPHGTRQLFSWYSVGDNRLYGRIEVRKGAAPTLRALKAIRALRPDGEPIYVILDNLNHHRGKDLRQWCSDHAVELCFTPTYASRANPIEAHFGPLREFTINNSDYPDHRALAKAVRSYVRWRNANTTDPEILALERKHRAAIRGEAQRRWGQPKRRAA
ncbi:MAG: Integrase catalytic region [Acidimicrobiaceae bacterium]|nr:Integrase catalytic region [Acidimicrobiaceae bacterium]